MNSKDKIVSLLTDLTSARERKNKTRAIGYIIQRDYNINISREKMTQAVGEILNLDRQWRKVLEDNIHLRGTDYDDKDELEKEKQRELGYN